MEALLAAVGSYLKTQVIGWVKRNASKIAVAVVLGLLTVTVLSGALFSAVLGGSGSASVAAGVCSELGYDVDPATYDTETAEGGEMAGLDPAQVDVARAIITAGQASNVPQQGLVVAIATALQESGLTNREDGDRDSVRVFQQRPSQGWGTVEQLKDVDFQARGFFGGPRSPHHDPVTGRTEPPGLLDVPGWLDMPVTVAAQAVQRSGFPDAYADDEARAREIVAALLGTTTGADADAGDSTTGLTSAADFRAAGIDIDAHCAGTYTRTTPAGGPLDAGGGPPVSADGTYRGILDGSGRLNPADLCPIPWVRAGLVLRCDAADALTRLNTAYRSAFGVDLGITDAYRDYAAQIAVYAAKPHLAARPGTSNHGWGLAVDLSGIGGEGTVRHTWLRANGPLYGWQHPSWARVGGSKPESWHFEYVGPPQGAING